MSWIITPQRKLDADAADYIARVEAADGQALELSVTTAIDLFVRGCKADGTWNAIKASCILAGARTLSGALVPLVGAAPTNVNFVSGDYNRKTGLVGNGSTKYLNSNRANNADSTLSHLSAWVSVTPTTNNAYYIGAGNGTVYNVIGTQGIYVNTGNFVIGSVGVGLHATSRTSSSLVDIKRPGAAVVATSLAFVSQASVNHYVFGINTNGTLTNVGNSRISFYSIGESLDLALLDARVTALINAFATVIP